MSPRESVQIILSHEQAIIFEETIEIILPEVQILL